jgi:dephospho-CoA kinase
MTGFVRAALTGGIATGKSHVRALFSERGVPTLDADIVAREVVEPGTRALAAVVARFGDSILQPDGRLDRRALASVVFTDERARHDLEAIVHPAVYAAIQRWLTVLEAAGRSPLALADIPLLYETAREGDFDAVVVAACHADVQLQRIMMRDRMTEEEARRRLAAQWPLAEKIALADHVIWTDRSFEETERQVEEVYRRFLTLSAGS